MVANCKICIKGNRCDFCKASLIEHSSSFRFKVGDVMLVYNGMSNTNVLSSDIAKIVQLKRTNARIVKIFLLSVITLTVCIIFYFLTVRK